MRVLASGTHRQKPQAIVDPEPRVRPRPCRICRAAKRNHGDPKDSSAPLQKPASASANGRILSRSSAAAMEMMALVVRVMIVSLYAPSIGLPLAWHPPCTRPDMPSRGIAPNAPLTRCPIPGTRGRPIGPQTTGHVPCAHAYGISSGRPHPSWNAIDPGRTVRSMRDAWTRCAIGCVP